MKEKRSNWRNGLRLGLVSGIVMSILIILFLIDFSSRVDYEVSKMAGVHLQDIGKQSTQIMEASLESARNEISDMGNYFSSLEGKSIQQAELLLEQIQEREEFTGVRVLNAKGEVFAPDGTRMEKHELSSDMGKQCIEAILEGKSGISNVFPSALTKDNIFVVYAPVIQGKKVIGGVAGTMILGKLVDTVASTGFAGHCYNYIVTSQGELIMRSSHPDSLYGGQNFFDFLESTDSRSLDPEEIREYMNNQESGFFTYQNGGQNRLAYFTPSKINNWYVITAVTAGALQDYKDSIHRTAFYLTLKIACMFLIAAALIVWWSYKTRKLIMRSKEELEIEKKKLQLSLRHTSSQIFEYREDLDEMSFLDGYQITGQELPAVISDFTKKSDSQGLVAEESFSLFCGLLRLASRGEACKSVELRGGKWFKEEYWFRLSLSVIENDRGHVLDVIGTMEDFTKEKKTRRRYEQEEQYRNALLSETVAIWSVDLARQKVLTCSVSGREISTEGSQLYYDDQFLDKIGIHICEDDRKTNYELLQIPYLLAAYYTEKRNLKTLFRICYQEAETERWVSCNISLLSEPHTGNPIVFAYLRDVDAGYRREMELTYSSERDPLTGLYNRRNIAEKVNNMLKTEGGIFCLLMMDMDGFKGINDRFGHQEGDRVLKAVAQLLSRVFPPDDLVARMGGDEFVVFISRLSGKKSAYEKAEQARRQVEELACQQELPALSISIGMAFAPEAGEDFPFLYKHADEALYDAKNEGKNSIVVYSGI